MRGSVAMIALLAFEFRIEDAQRIRFDAPRLSPTELVPHFQEFPRAAARRIRPQFLSPMELNIKLNALQTPAGRKRQ